VRDHREGGVIGVSESSVKLDANYAAGPMAPSEMGSTVHSNPRLTDSQRLRIVTNTSARYIESLLSKIAPKATIRQA